MEPQIRRQIEQRAEQRCEYCRIPQDGDRMPFHIDHIRPRKHHGDDSLNNLAWSCFACSTSKGYAIAGYNDDDELTRLFHPRQDDWSEHFALSGAELICLTEIGRVTIDVLNINQPMRIALREALLDEGRLT